MDADELKEQTALADTAEATGVFFHELGNVLNNLLLDAKLLQRKLPPEHRERLAQSCDLITEAAEQMKATADYRQTVRVSPYPVDVKALTEEVVAAFEVQDGKIEQTFADELAPILATKSDMGRIIRLLLKNALAVSTANVVVVSGTMNREKDNVDLLVRAVQPSCNADQVSHIFEPFARFVADWNHLEAAMCRNLVRRTNGRIEARLDDRGDLNLAMTWPTV